MAASTFDHTGADGPTLGQIPIVVHVGQVASVVTDACVQGLALGRRGRRALDQASQGLDDGSRFARQDLQQLYAQPSSPVEVSLTQDGVGRIPKIPQA